VAAEFVERRRSPRVPVVARHEFRLGRRLRLRIVDISVSGALLGSEEPLPLGAKGRLHMLLGAGDFEAQIEVKREQPAPDGRGTLLGTTMTPSQPRHHEVLEQFLSRAGS
jgi:PilZ domain-containing protein